MDNLSIMPEVPDQSHSVPMSPSVVSPAVSSPAVLPKTSAPIFTSWAIWFAPAALITLGLDLLSKQVLFAMPHSTEFPSWISLAYNQGVAWSLFAEHPWLVVGLTVVLIPVLAWVWWATRSIAWEWPAANCPGCAISCMSISDFRPSIPGPPSISPTRGSAWVLLYWCCFHSGPRPLLRADH